MPYLYGKTVVLRDYRSEDLPFMRAWVNDPETVRYLSSRYWTPQTQGNTAEYLDHVMHSAGSSAFFVIADGNDGHYLGQIDFPTINWKLRSAELAMVIGDGKQRGQGIGSEAIALMLEYAFGMLGLERVELEVAQGNARAVRCYERAGFVTEGIKRHAFMVDGEYADVVMMSVLKGEWHARKAKA